MSLLETEDSSDEGRIQVLDWREMREVVLVGTGGLVIEHGRVRDHKVRFRPGTVDKDVLSVSPGIFCIQSRTVRK